MQSEAILFMEHRHTLAGDRHGASLCLTHNVRPKDARTRSDIQRLET
jgi:hypothetical protein